MAGVAGEAAIAVRLSATDNVATLLAPAAAGVSVGIRDVASGRLTEDGPTAESDIPAGHKIALEPIPEGAPVRKYGAAIGRARAEIVPGEHVHVHNVESALSPAARKATACPAARSRTVAPDRLRSAIAACLRAAGVPDAPAASMTDHLVEAHLRGVETHGVRRLKPYIARIGAGGVDAATEPDIDRRGAILRVNGRNGIGHHVAARTADAVAAQARRHGAAVALVRNSNHFGFAGYYATRIAGEGAAALVTSNGQVCIGPVGAKRALFSNDPVAVAAPLRAGAFFEFDMATSVTSRAKIAQAAERGEALAPGLALDEEGKPTTDPRAALGGLLLPFGGDKGFAFIAALELLTGVLTGGAYADLVASKEADPAAPEGTAHFMLAVDLESALGRASFEERLADMVRRMGAPPMREGWEPPRHPGARRWALRRERSAGGVPLTDGEYAGLHALAAELGVDADLQREGRSSA